MLVFVLITCGCMRFFVKKWEIYPCRYSPTPTHGTTNDIAPSEYPPPTRRTCPSPYPTPNPHRPGRAPVGGPHPNALLQLGSVPRPLAD
ncbi:hypothetical protein GCM10027423_46110 [Spirosoma arcticum]